LSLTRKSLRVVPRARAYVCACVRACVPVCVRAFVWSVFQQGMRLKSHPSSFPVSLQLVAALPFPLWVDSEFQWVLISAIEF
jgi:hypothetical protein